MSHLLQLVIKDAIHECDSINRPLVKVGHLNTERWESNELGGRSTTVCIAPWSRQESVLRLLQKDLLWQSKLKTNVAHITLNKVR